MEHVKSGLIIALVGIVIIFTLQNTELLNVEFLFWSFSLRRAVLLFVVLVVGIVTGYILSASRHSRLRSQDSRHSGKNGA
ncbi:MAG TPA: lipopolysaccharide assembly protein LapA domain-containing protein [Alphaproteobacteria bacterium]|nr:lipopolysaccharide assembly protein LapA domain-containing protein [Alphaproteobacteria bacterium]